MRYLVLLLLGGCMMQPGGLHDAPPTGLTCAPNGTCWPANYQPVKDVRIIKLHPDRVNDTCGILLDGQWQLQPGKRYLACAVLTKTPSPIIYLPTHLRQANKDEGWTLELLEQYERANADGVTIYPDNGPARRVK